MSLNPDTRFGPYEIADEIGAGGMGVVYRATDTNLKRDVAIKALPESLATDTGRLARFQREAEVLASLNHPNIAQIYGLEKADGTTALIMELVDGETLADRIAKGPLPPDEALGIAMQIAEALEAAHRQNIVHRDLKPANVKLRPDGTVKVLDFGIAKALEPENLASEAQSPMMTTPATVAGVILGTAAYMSPEQAKGKAIDQRTDIWAFGCVLYEMLTGQLAFGAEDVPTTLARVIAHEADLGSLPAATPPAVGQMIKLCLQKDVRRRLQSIGDARLVLDGAFDAVSRQAAEAVAVRPLWRRALPVTAAVLVTAVLAGFAGSMLRPVSVGEPSGNVRRSNIIVGATEPVGVPPLSAHVALSPDGLRLVYAAQVDGTSQLYLRAIDQLESRSMPGTDGALYPFFSPDGEWVGFFDDILGELKKISVRGGPPQPLTGALFSGGGSWPSDDTIIFGSGDPTVGRMLFRVPATGGARDVLIPPEPNTGHTRPEVLPGGGAVLLTIRTGVRGVDPARDGSIAVLSLETNELRSLVERGHTPRYAPTGHILFVRSGDLWAVPFDTNRMETTGPEVPVVDGVDQDGLLGGAAYAISNDGTLVYAPGGEQGVALERSLSLVWVGRQGQEEPLGFAANENSDMRLSPDGQRLAISINEEGNQDIWIYDLTRGTSNRLTFEPSVEERPVWTADGGRIIFESDRDEGGIYWKEADGTGQTELLLAIGEGTLGATEQTRTLDAGGNADNRSLPNFARSGGLRRRLSPDSVSPDGQLIFEQLGADYDLHILSLQGEPTSRPLVELETNQEFASISPDGRWIAYSSSESGRGELYVQPFPDVDQGKWQISSAGGVDPIWSRDGRELFFIGSNEMMAVTVETEPAFSAGIPRSLFSMDSYSSRPNSYAVSADEQRFLMLKLASQEEQSSEPKSLVLVDNWFEELRRLAPPAE